MKAYDYLLDDLFYFAASHYEFSYEDPEQEHLCKIVERQDEKIKELIESIMEQWQRYGFVNGFAYAIRLLNECWN